MMKFRQMVSSQVKIRFELIPEDSMVPSRLISGTMVQTVKVWMQRMIKIGRSVGFATRNAKYLDVLLAMKNAQRNPMNHSSGKEWIAYPKVAAWSPPVWMATL